MGPLTPGDMAEFDAYRVHVEEDLDPIEVAQHVPDKLARAVGRRLQNIILEFLGALIVESVLPDEDVVDGVPQRDGDKDGAEEHVHEHEPLAPVVVGGGEQRHDQEHHPGAHGEARVTERDDHDARVEPVLREHAQRRDAQLAPVRPLPRDLADQRHVVRKLAQRGGGRGVVARHEQRGVRDAEVAVHGLRRRAAVRRPRVRRDRQEPRRDHVHLARARERLEHRVVEPPEYRDRGHVFARLFRARVLQHLWRHEPGPGEIARQLRALGALYDGQRRRARRRARTRRRRREHPQHAQHAQHRDARRPRRPRRPRQAHAA